MTLVQHKKIIPNNPDIEVEIFNFNQIEGEPMDRVITYQLKRKRLRQLKKLMKQWFKEDYY